MRWTVVKGERKVVAANYTGVALIVERSKIMYAGGWRYRIRPPVPN